MEDSHYEEHLKKCNIQTLKQIIKKYMTHVKILVTGKSKGVLIQHILQHTKLIDGRIYLKPINFDVPGLTDKKEKRKVTKKPSKTVQKPEPIKPSSLVDVQKKGYKEVNSNQRVTRINETRTNNNLEQAYKTLGLSSNASIDQVKSAYKKLSLLYHPDKNKDKNSTRKLLEIQNAYELITSKQNNNVKYIVDEFVQSLEEIDTSVHELFEQKEIPSLMQLIKTMDDSINKFFDDMDDLDNPEYLNELKQIINYHEKWMKIKEDAKEARFKTDNDFVSDVIEKIKNYIYEVDEDEELEKLYGEIMDANGKRENIIDEMNNAEDENNYDLFNELVNPYIDIMKKIKKYAKKANKLM